MKIISDSEEDYIKNLNYTRKIQGLFWGLEKEEDCLEEAKKQIKNDKE